MKELRKRYLERMSERIARMKGQLERSSWQELKSECHQVKGSAGTLGFERLGEVAAEANLAAAALKAGSGTAENRGKIERFIAEMEKQISQGEHS